MHNDTKNRMTRKENNSGEKYGSEEKITGKLNG